MPTGLVWDGLKEYQEELRRLPEECKKESLNLIQAAVNSAYVTISTVYGRHRFTGTLQARLRITPLKDGLRLVSGSPLAWIFENGSQARHWKSGRSTGEMWGRTPNPPTHIFTRTVGNARRTLAKQFREMLLRRGATQVIDTDA
jgi:hypothetical protein